MFEVFLFSRGLAVGLLLALILVTYILSRRHHAGRVLMFFAVCVIAYLLAPILHGTSDWFFLTDPFSNATPLAFLLLTQALFEDHKAAATSSALMGIGYMLLTYSGVVLRGVELIGADIGVILWHCGRAAIVAVLLISTFVVVRHWREDLVEPRRLLRWVITCVVGLSIMVVVVVESLPGGSEFSLWVGTAHTFLIIGFIIAFGVGLILLGPSQFIAQKLEEGTSSENPSPVETLEINQIVKAMEQDKLFREMDLSIKSLAATLGFPEHRLRKHISTQLGYRNFNDFINRYRIAEVEEKLATLELARVPVLTIAMEAGYRSLTTFNKAFRALNGMTPKEYRQKHQQIS